MTGHCVSAYGKTEYLGKTADYKIGGIFFAKIRYNGSEKG